MDGRIMLMDAIDRKILAELQKDGRLSFTELADRVQLSLSPCHRRVRTLEQAGIIAGYHASLDPKAIGLDFEALLFVTMRSADRDTLDAFEEAVTATPAIVGAQRLFGDPDYLLRIQTANLDAYQRLYDDHLARLPGVQRLTSTLVMKTVVADRPPFV
jgi:DNA-binding Lrp family transcriptional regulator